MSEFYAKAVLKMVSVTLTGDPQGLPYDLFEILVVLVLEHTSEQQKVEIGLTSQLSIAK